MEHNKLVRDNIPKIIADNGEKAEIKILSQKEFLDALDDKLQEEVKEFIDSHEMSELADVIEVIRAIIVARDSTIGEIEKLRITKKVDRGGFERRIFLIRTKK